MKTNKTAPSPRRLLPLAYLTCFAYLMLGLAACTDDDGGSPQIVTLTLTPSHLVLDLEEITNITAQFSPTNTADTNLTWTSSRPEVATVSNGQVTALYGGNTTIIATHGSGAVATVTVKVLQPATNINLFPTNFTLGVGGTQTIAVQFLPTNANTDIFWVSGDTSIATVADGVVTGVSSGGPITITASNAIGVTAAVTVKVLPTPNLSYRRVGVCPVDLSRLELYWDSVVGSTRYEVSRNALPTSLPSPTATNLSASNLPPGNHNFEVKACDGGGCSQPASLAVMVARSSLSNLITSGRVPSDLSSYDEASREIFSRYPVGAAVVARYVREESGGSGSTYADASGNVKTVLDGITNAFTTNVYAVLIAPGTYDAGEAIAMKNHVAIVGGVQCMEVAGNNPTVLSGGGTHQVFSNTDITNTAVLYGVTIADGYSRGEGGGMYNSNSSPILTEVIFSKNAVSRATANSGGGMYNLRSSPILTRVIFSENVASDGTANSGGGMYNLRSSPILTGVTLSGNTAEDGGGMYNLWSSPVLRGVTLSGNTAEDGGGGMYNGGSSPILTEVTLSGNTADDGGGMYNDYSSPILTEVTLSGNTADDGGGMANYHSSPVMTGVTLSGNTATYWGGGMYNDNNGADGPRLINTIIWGNTATTGNQIYFRNDGSDQENFHLYHSLIQDGLPPGYTSGTTNTSFNGRGFASGGGTAPIVVTFSNITTIDPGLLPLADNGGGIFTHAIPTSSSAVNQGVYVRRSAAPTGRGCIYEDGKNYCDLYTLYYSPDNNKWYSTPELTTDATPPTDAVDLTATDATGRNRSGRPDLGAYEAR